MEEQKQEHFTKYEIARVIGARALQIAMDAPLLIKTSEETLKSIKYDPIKIAELEFQAGILPIAIQRPLPRKKKEKLAAVKEEKISDEELLAKEQEVEKEIVENLEEYSLTQEEEESTDTETAPSKEE